MTARACQPLTLLFCHNRYQKRTGEDIVFDAAVKLLLGQGHRVTKVERQNRELGHMGLSARARAAMRIVFDPRVYADVTAAIERTDPAVGLVQNTIPLLTLAPYLALADAGVPTIQLLYNYRYLCLNGELYTGGEICERCACGNYWHGVLRRCYRGSLLQSAALARVSAANRRREIWKDHVTAFVAPDNFLVDKMVAHGLERDRFHVIPNPIEIPSRPAPLEHDGSVVFVGRWTRAKGVRTLLEAAMVPGTPPITLIGGGPEEKVIESHPAVQAERVRVLGPIYGDELDVELRRAAALVAPSEWYDNLPMVVSQAFANGRPVVASRINGIPEYVREGENGWLFEPGDVEGLAEALRAVGASHDVWSARAMGARATAEAEFSPERWQARWQAVFDSVRR